MRWRLGWVALLTTALAGCGGSDYRAQVEKTRQRMALLDEENAILEEPVFLPEGGAPIYFRPPRGVAVRPSEKSYPASDWLYHLPWTEARFLVPALEVFVGATPKATDERLDDFLQSRVLEYLRQHADERLLPRAGESPRDLTLTRHSDPAQERRPLQYRRFAYQSEHESPQWPAPDRPRLPERCVYHYDIYITDTGELWGVVILKSLNHEATLAAWKRANLPADVLLKLPSKRLLHVDAAGNLDVEQASLSTLVIGARARARLRVMGR